MEPLMYGDYPISMKRNAGARIPAFTSHESEQVKGSSDFIGVIHYTNVNITDNSEVLNIKLRDYSTDMAAKIRKYLVNFKDGELVHVWESFYNRFESQNQWEADVSNFWVSELIMEKEIQTCI